MLPSENRAELFFPTLPALVRICEAFPPLVEDIVSLLMQLGRVCVSEASLNSYKSPQYAEMFILNSSLASPLEDDSTKKSKKPRLPTNEALCIEIQRTFSAILSKAVLKVKIY